MSVTRHQFLLDPAIAYTSHNSRACITLKGPPDLDPVRVATAVMKGFKRKDVQTLQLFDHVSILGDSLGLFNDRA